ncbi:MAG: FKBP-type peptidyl-prolyl cis-trans isomerase [Vicinamibacterales bacterium]
MSRRRTVALWAGLVAAVTLAGCSSTAPSLNIPFSTTDLVVGTGAVAANGDDLLVHYTLWLYDPDAAGNKGRLIESSVGGNPFPFRLGNREVIEGWDQGIPGMATGGTRRLVIPPELGYGSSGSGPIPGNATLIFEVELLSVS